MNRRDMMRAAKAAKMLVIVSRDHLYLVDLVRRHFKRAEHIEVIVDRRQRERRTGRETPRPGDRRGDDRRQHDIQAELRSIGWTMIRGSAPMPPDASHSWHLPWVRVELLLRMLQGTRWDREVWPTAEATLRDALGARNRILREGWFN